jgi:hypothetical protein
MVVRYHVDTNRFRHRGVVGDKPFVYLHRLFKMTPEGQVVMGCTRCSWPVDRGEVSTIDLVHDL